VFVQRGTILKVNCRFSHARKPNKLLVPVKTFALRRRRVKTNEVGATQRTDTVVKMRIGYNDGHRAVIRIDRPHLSLQDMIRTQ
jgi:hypothetical protein